MRKKRSGSHSSAFSPQTDGSLEADTQLPGMYRQQYNIPVVATQRSVDPLPSLDGDSVYHLAGRGDNRLGEGDDVVFDGHSLQVEDNGVNPESFLYQMYHMS